LTFRAVRLHICRDRAKAHIQAYRDLGKFRQRFPLVPITVGPAFTILYTDVQALTASATEDVRSDILSTLGIKRELLFQRVEPCNRKNLFYEVSFDIRVWSTAHPLRSGIKAVYKLMNGSKTWPTSSTATDRRLSRETQNTGFEARPCLAWCIAVPGAL
jgi:hypothetical protein